MMMNHDLCRYAARMSVVAGCMLGACAAEDAGEAAAWGEAEVADDGRDIGTINQAVAATWSRIGSPMDKAKDVAANFSGPHFVVGTNDQVYEYVPATNSYSHIAGISARRITVGPNRRPWVTDLNNRVFRYTAPGWAAVGPSNTCALDIGSNGSDVWAVGCIAVANGTGFEIYHWTGSTWQAEPAPTAGNRIAIYVDNQPWIINGQGKIFGKNANGVWTEAPGNGTGTDIAVDNFDRPYVIGTDVVGSLGGGRVYRKDPAQAFWDPVGEGRGSSIAIGATSPTAGWSVFVSNSQNDIYRADRPL